ncbi:MAG: type IV pilin, partial [Actinobacteria bacterium]|nr:type IV pilin [Actinomycetota bacterium]
MSRAAVPVLGAVLLVGVTVLLAVALGAAAAGFDPSSPAEPVVLEASADAVTGRVTLEHVMGPALDVRRIDLAVAVDGEPLAHQP